MKKRIQVCITSILIAAAITSLLTGCGAGSKSHTVVSETAAARSDDTNIMTPEFEVPAETAAGGTLTSTAPLEPVSSSRKLIRNVNLSVETTGFDAMISSLTDRVSSLGGYVEQSEISGNSVSSSYHGNRYAYLTVRVPSDKLDTFITQVGEQGNITNQSGTTQDVTLQYSDIESRKKSLTIEQERLWALLEKADTLEAVIALESRLSEIRYQLESFESQLRTYDNQVDYSTVYLSISEVTVFTPTAPDSVADRIQKGFRRNLNNVGNALVNFFVWLISSLPVLIPLAIFAAIIFLLVRGATRKQLSKAAKVQEPIAPLSQPLPPLKTGPDEELTTANDPNTLKQQNQQNQ